MPHQRPLAVPAAPVSLAVPIPAAHSVPAAADFAAIARAIAPTPPEAPPAALAAVHHHSLERITSERTEAVFERETIRTVLPQPAAERPAPTAPSRAPALAAQPVPVAAPVRAQAPSPSAMAAPSWPEPPPLAAPQAAAPIGRLRAEPEEVRPPSLPRALTSGLPSAARQRPRESEQPASVEVVLDGAAIGRWMDQRLARAASRPTSGVTGFDPRLSPVWTTAPVN